MVLADATNVVATDAPSATATKTMSQASDVPNAPNTEKLVAALDDVASFAAAKRDAAAAKLDAASAKDAPGLCIALLRVASDRAHGSARRLAAGTFARNLLRKAFWTPRRTARRSRTHLAPPSASRRSMRSAPRPTGHRARSSPSASASRARSRPPRSEDPRIHLSDRASSSSPASSEDPRADLALDVCERLARHESSFVSSSGFLLATHAAARPFQYFRDAATAREAAPEALETLCGKVIAPHVVPMCGSDDARVRRAALKVAFRAVRAYMPDALRGEATRSIIGSISRSMAILRKLVGRRRDRVRGGLDRREARVAIGQGSRDAPRVDARFVRVPFHRGSVRRGGGRRRSNRGPPTPPSPRLSRASSPSSRRRGIRTHKGRRVGGAHGLRARDDARRVSALKDLIAGYVVREFARTAMRIGGGSGGVRPRQRGGRRGDRGRHRGGARRRWRVVGGHREGRGARIRAGAGDDQGPGGRRRGAPAKKHKKDTKKDTKKDGEDGEGKAPPPTPGSSR